MLGHPRKAVSAARNAVARRAKKPSRRSRSTSTRWPRRSSMRARRAKAEQLLDDGRRRRCARTSSRRCRERGRAQESFEVYSSARGDVAAYVSLLNRAQLRLGALYEARGDRERRAHAIRARARRPHATTRPRSPRSRDWRTIRRSASGCTRGVRREPVLDAARTRVPASGCTTHRGQPKPSTANAARARAIGATATCAPRARRSTRCWQKFPANETLRALRREAEASRTLALPSATLRRRQSCAHSSRASSTHARAARVARRDRRSRARALRRRSARNQTFASRARSTACASASASR